MQANNLASCAGAPVHNQQSEAPSLQSHFPEGAPPGAPPLAMKSGLGPPAPGALSSTVSMPCTAQPQPTSRSGATILRSTAAVSALGCWLVKGSASGCRQKRGHASARASRQQSNKAGRSASTSPTGSQGCCRPPATFSACFEPTYLALLPSPMSCNPPSVLLTKSRLPLSVAREVVLARLAAGRSPWAMW